MDCDFALRQYGRLARTVLAKWHIHSTDDFGKIVFAMIEAKILAKTEENSAEDFRAVFDFSLRRPRRRNSLKRCRNTGALHNRGEFFLVSPPHRTGVDCSLEPPLRRRLSHRMKPVFMHVSLIVRYCPRWTTPVQVFTSMAVSSTGDSPPRTNDTRLRSSIKRAAAARPHIRDQSLSSARTSQ